MKYFIGIVPPENIYSAISNIQIPFGDNRLEPHITLRAPVTTADLDSWLTAIKNISNTFPEFSIQLPGTGYFGKRVLYIKIVSPPLCELYNILIPAIEPFEVVEKGESRDYHPHLTLGRKWCGFTPAHFTEMQHLADEYLAAEEVKFTAEFLRVYNKPGHSKKYETLLDFPLSNPAICSD